MMQVLRVRIPVLCGLFLALVVGCAKKAPSPEMAVKPSAGQGEDEAARRERERQAEQAALAERERAAAEAERQRQADQERMMRQAFSDQDVYFAYDSFLLSDEAKSVLDQKAAWLQEHAAVNVQIEGHCDERGTSVYNLALGERRANAAEQYLRLLGIPGQRMSTISYGEERPLDPGHNEAAWASNRRAHFVVLP